MMTTSTKTDKIVNAIILIALVFIVSSIDYWSQIV